MRSPSLTTMHLTRRNGMTQNLIDAVFVGVTEKQAARLAPDLAEALASLAHRGRQGLFSSQ
jgi:hypothetical protein